MSSKPRKGKGQVPVSSRQSKSRGPEKGTRLTLSNAAAISSFMVSALAALTALAGVLHHLLVWLVRML
jgi:hypothetical protein